MSELIVTTNVGGGFGGQARHEGMIDWARHALTKSPALVFAQEVPASGWLDVWTDAGYQVVMGPPPHWKTRSALILRPGIEWDPLEHRNASYHGSYLAGARVKTRVGPVIAVSMHASPNEAEPVKYGWVDPRPSPRHGGEDRRYRSDVLWDSDLVLSTLLSLSSQGTPLLAAGDLNEAKAYDHDPASGLTGTWGREYFERVKAGGLTEALTARWMEERPTRGELQLDRVIVNDTGRQLLADAVPIVDPAWSLPGHAEHQSDHAPVWLELEDIWL